jgi:signal transduction histidine kinase
VPFLEAAAARGLLSSAAAGERALLLEVVDRKLGEITGAASAGGGTDPEAARFEGVKAAMTQMCSGISFPLIAGDRVLGFWNLWDDRVPEAYSSDEIAAMLEVAERAAVVLENSQLFERMKERDRLAALGEMAAGLAHEIRNPLGAIKGAAQYLNPAGRPGDEGDLLQVIVEEVNRLNGVVTEFLDYSRPIKSQLAPININDVLQRTVKLLESQGLPPGIAIDLRLSDDLPPAQGDAEQLKQVFINLAFNAVQAMPKGGTLTIRTDALAASSATWRFAEVGPSRARKTGGPELMEVRFRDTGEGISDEAREHIFIPFYTTKAKGTGLGLAIVQRIVKAHNGVISVESQPGLGTEFIVRIPIAGDQLTPAPFNRPLEAVRARAQTAGVSGPPTSPHPDSGPPSRPPDLQPRRDPRRRRQRSR